MPVPRSRKTHLPNLQTAMQSGRMALTFVSFPHAERKCDMFASRQSLSEKGSKFRSNL